MPRSRLGHDAEENLITCVGIVIDGSTQNELGCAQAVTQRGPIVQTHCAKLQQLLKKPRKERQFCARSL